jgi:hypothetical protein
MTPAVVAKHLRKRGGFECGSNRGIVGAEGFEKGLISLR